jgi:phage recombination protein Bet
MSTAVAKQAHSAMPALAMSEEELIGVLTNSLYPGAASGSIKLVIGYCKAAGLDPMQKPVHIVPMWDNKAKQMRDVVMPGIGLYRTQAARSGEYAGVTEPEFGDDITESVGGVQITYPKWCKVTVRRLLPNGTVVDFTAKELWKENYATKGKDSVAPNAMWLRRPYAQLAKCAEAQALRKAFPEFGAQPTADEMEGRELDMGAAEVISSRPSAPAAPAALPDYSQSAFADNLPKWSAAILSGKLTADEVITRASTKGVLSEAQKAQIRAAARPNEPEPEVIDAPAQAKADDDGWLEGYEAVEAQK